MPAIQYIDKQFSASSLEVIEWANAIIGEYQAAGHKLTLRQLYYQFVARDLIPNTQRSYKRIGSIVADGRNAGLIDWDAIEDRTRHVRKNPHWDSPADILRSCADQFRYDLWEGQQWRPEVWIEKDALVGVFERACQRLDVPLFSCRGYTSQSEAWAAGRRLMTHLKRGQQPVILHFGDHDPSGLDMTRDISDRLELYAEWDVEVKRLALNMDQVAEYEPPPNPAKVTDSRYATYVMVHGEESWELDALEPQVLERLVEKTIEGYQDETIWREAKERQRAARKKLRGLAESWAREEQGE